MSTTPLRLSEVLKGLPAFESAFSPTTAKALFERLAPQKHKATQATIATGFIPVHIAQDAEIIKSFSAKVDICGVSGTTSVMPQIVRKGQSSAAAIDLLAATIDFGNADADGEQFRKVAGNNGAVGDFKANTDITLNPGDALYVHVSAAAGSATGLLCEFEVEPRVDQ